MTMTLRKIYKLYSTEGKCISLLEKLRWSDGPICPYCKSPNPTPVPKENRYHCNFPSCNRSFSVTVGTIFQKSRLDLQKWFYAVYILLVSDPTITARELAERIEVTKDTAWLMTIKIRRALLDNSNMLQGIISDMQGEGWTAT